MKYEVSLLQRGYRGKRKAEEIRRKGEKRRRKWEYSSSEELSVSTTDELDEQTTVSTTDESDEETTSIVTREIHSLEA